MSSGSANAITALITLAAPAPEGSAAAAVSAPAGASAPSAFSRLLDAEAQLAQAVAQWTSQTAPVAPQPNAASAAPLPLANGSDALPVSSFAAESLLPASAELDSHIALALAQAAQAGLSQSPRIQVEETVDTEALADVEVAEAKAESQTVSEHTTAELHLPSRPLRGESEAEPRVTPAAVPFARENSMPVKAPQQSVIRQSPDAVEKMEFVESHESMAPSQPPPFAAKPVSHEALSMDHAQTLTPKRLRTPQVPDGTAGVQIQPIFARMPLAALDTQTVSHDRTVEPVALLETPLVFDERSDQHRPQADGRQSYVSLVPAAKASTPALVTHAVETLKVEPSEETAPEEMPAEFFLGAAGVLNTEFVSTRVQAFAAPDIESDAPALNSNTVSADRTFAAPSELARRVESAVRKPDAAPSSFEIPTQEGAVVASERNSGADVESDSPADFTDAAETLHSANATPARHEALPRIENGESLPDEVRVIATQLPREAKRAASAAQPAETNFEFRADAPSLPAAPADFSTVRKSARIDVPPAATTTVTRAEGPEKGARKSSPEAFSFEAQRSENSASAATAPFSDGSRSETIASRNTSDVLAPTLSTRAERMLTQTLEAIPNPLRVTTFEIHPEGHGPIRVRISARGEGENTIWRVQIQTQDSAARSLLNDHLHELRERMPAEHVKVEVGGVIQDVRTETPQRDAGGGGRERGGEQRQSRGEEQQRQRQKSDFLEWLAAQK